MMVTAIIVIYKADKDLLSRTLNRIGSKLPIIIVDNSKNYNFNNINISSNTKIIRSKNLGNGSGFNQALKKVKTKYAIYFDIDTIFSKNIIYDFLNLAKKIKDFALLIPNHGKVYSKKEFIDYHDGEASIMMMNISKIRKLNFFDENFFLYFEEIDLIKRCQKANEKVYILPRLKIKHKRASSISIDLENTNSLRSWHYMWSMFYFYKKHFGYFRALLKIKGFFVKDIIKLIIYIITFNFNNIKIRFYRIYGLLTSILLIKSFLRP